MKIEQMVDKIGCFIIDLEGLTLTKEEQEMLAHPVVGGVILFARNYASKAQLRLLCQSIRAFASHPLLIMVDQEGGRVQRFIKEFTRLPPMGYLREKYDQNPNSAQEIATNLGWIMAKELLTEGVDLSLAPVLDLNKNKNTVIGDRAFHANPQAVAYLASAFITGMNEAGMAAVGKHFPGHGDVNADSHVDLPIDRRNLEEVANEDLIPFIQLSKWGIKALMTAHIVYPEVDNLPVGFSHKWLQDILRLQVGFSGTIFSDDLNMAGANISKSYVDRVEAARHAGCDFVLLCNNRQGVIEVLDHLSYEKHLLNKEKWGFLQGNFSIQPETFTNDERLQKTHKWLQSEGQQWQ